MNKKYLRAKEVAEYLAIGVSTVWYLVAKNRLVSKKLSARVTVFSIEDVEKLFDNNVEVS